MKKKAHSRGVYVSMGAVFDMQSEHIEALCGIAAAAAVAVGIVCTVRLAEAGAKKNE